MDKEAVHQSYETLMEFGERYRADAEVRARIARGDTSDLGMDGPEGVEIRVMQQTADTYYFALPQLPTTALSAEALETISGGITLTNTGRAGNTDPALLFTVFQATFGVSCAGPGRSCAS